MSIWIKTGIVALIYIASYNWGRNNPHEGSKNTIMAIMTVVILIAFFGEVMIEVFLRFANI